MLDYKVSEFFSSIFEIHPEVFCQIKDHMVTYGYDESYPVILGTGDWTDIPIVIDGHTRLRVANELGIIPKFITKQFSSEEDALNYAIHNQRDRRNLTAGEISRCVLALEPLKQKYFKKDSNGRFVVDRPEKNPKELQVFKNSEYDTPVSEVASKLGVSKSTVQNVRNIFSDNTPDDIKEAVLNDEISINKAKEIIDELKEHGHEKVDSNVYRPTFNSTNSNIEWAKWSWNPVTGCYNNCQFCYAKYMSLRFSEDKFEYTVHRERFSAPQNMKIPKGRIDEEGIRNVFVCSMADLFGDWVEEGVIQEILDICAANPQWNFIFLTKNPKRLLEFEFPKNSWVGTTVHEKSYVEVALSIMPKVNAPVKFVSCEPLLEDLEIKDLTGIDWVIIGGCTKTPGHPAFQPKWEWVEDLLVTARKSNCKVYFKPNLTVVPKEYPNY